MSDQPWEQKTMKAGHAGGQEGTKHHLLIKVEVQDSPLLEQKVTSRVCIDEEPWSRVSSDEHEINDFSHFLIKVLL